MLGPRTQREVTSERRKQQAVAIQQLAELRRRKSGTEVHAVVSHDENCSLAANKPLGCGVVPTAPAPKPAARARMEESSSSGDEDWARPTVPLQIKPLRRLRRLHSPQAAAQAAAVDEQAGSRVLNTPARGGEAHPGSTGSSQGDGCRTYGKPLKAAESEPQSTPGDLVLGERSEFVLPCRVASRLYSHQVEGVRWLFKLHASQSGGILGDDMGLGKTMQCAAFLAGLFHSGLIRRALVVAPKTLLAHWAAELGACGLARLVCEFYGGSARERHAALLLRALA